MSSVSQQVPKRARSQKLREGKLAQPTSLCKFQLLWSKIMSHRDGILKTLKLLQCFFLSFTVTETTLVLWAEICFLSMNYTPDSKTEWSEVKRMPLHKDNWSVLACKYCSPESHHNSSKVPVFTRNLMCRVYLEMDRQLAGALKRSAGLSCMVLAE